MHKAVVGHKISSIALVLFSVIGILLIWLSSFRLGIGNIEIAWQSNLDRTVAAMAAGIAFAGTGALSNTQSNIRFHVLAFAIVTVASTLLLLGTFLTWHPSLTLAVSAIGCGAVYVVISRIANKKSVNVWTAIILSIAFLLCVLNFIGASSLSGSAGQVVFWLQGDLQRAGPYSALGLLLSLILFVWMLISSSKAVPASLLLGLGLGIAGPILFVGCLVPLLIDKLSKAKEKSFLISCAAIGSLLIVLADSGPRLLLGGYSTTLVIPIALISIPLILIFQRAASFPEFPSGSRSVMEACFIAVWVAGFSILLFHVIEFASLAT